MDDKNALKTAWVNSMRGGLVETGAASALPEMTEPPKLGVQLPTSLEDLRQSFAQQQPGVLPAKQKWYTSAAFIQTAIVVGVFLVVFILLVAIQPPFLNTRPREDENVEPKFSAGNAAWFAFGSCAVCGVIYAIMAGVAMHKKRSALKYPAQSALVPKQ